MNRMTRLFEVQDKEPTEKERSVSQRADAADESKRGAPQSANKEDDRKAATTCNTSWEDVERTVEL